MLPNECEKESRHDGPVGCGKQSLLWGRQEGRATQTAAFAFLLGKFVAEPVEALVQTVALRRTRGLDVPLRFGERNTETVCEVWAGQRRRTSEQHERNCPLAKMAHLHV